MKKQKGFTLIELLVVISIIGLISSIVLVSVKIARDRARIAAGLQFSSSVHHALGAEAVGIWDFDEGSGTTARDFSGNGNNGTLYSGASACSDPPTSDCPKWITDTLSGTGYALSFDGSNDYVRVNDSSSLDITGDITIEVWVKFSDLTAKRSIVGKKQGWAAYSLRINQDVVDQRLCFFVEGGDETKLYKVFSTTQVVSGRWYHVVGVRKEADLKIYVDGNLENIASAPLMGENDWPLYIGADPSGVSPPGGQTYFFSGVIDQVRIYEEGF